MFSLFSGCTSDVPEYNPANDGWILYDQNNFNSTVFTSGFNSSPTISGDGLFSISNNQCYYTGTTSTSYYAIFTDGLTVNSNCKLKLYVEPVSFSTSDISISLGCYQTVYDNGFVVGTLTNSKISIYKTNGNGGSTLLKTQTYTLSNFTDIAFEVIIEGTTITARLISTKTGTEAVKITATAAAADVAAGNVCYRCDGNGNIYFDNLKIFYR